MVIAFDTFFLAENFRNVGIYEYARNLLIEFHRLAQEDRSVEIRYFVSPGYFDDRVGITSIGCEPVHTRLLRFHRLWRLGLINAAASRARADLIFTPSPSVLPLGSHPFAVTIHDAMPETLPAELVERSTRLRAAYWIAAKFSQRILTVSEHSKKDLVGIYKLPPEKVSVVYLGYDREKFNASPPDAAAQESLLARLGIKRPYILHHGMVQLRKNLGRLLRAYEILLDGQRDLDLQLVLAGPYGWGSEQIRQEAEKLVARGKVIFTGPLTDPELSLLVKGASLCVIPSLYEGFCLPMLEAMACGVATIASNSSCLPEVSGGVLRYFDPMSAEDIAETIRQVWGSRELREKLAGDGLKRASEFSWTRCAQETLMALTGMDARRAAMSN